MKQSQSFLHSSKAIFASADRVLHLVWACSPALTLLTTLTTLTQSLLPAASAYAGKLVVDSVVQVIGDPILGLNSVLPAVALALGLGVLGTLLGRGGQLAQELLRDLLSNRINETIIEKALTLDLSFYENPAFYDMLQRAQREAGFRPLMLLTQTLTIASSSVTAVSLLALLLRFNVGIALILVITVLPALFVQARYGREAFHLFSWRAPEARKLAYYSRLLTSDQWAKEVKLFRLGRLLFDRYRALFARFYRQNRALAVRRNLSAALLSLLSTFGYYGCYVYVIRQTIVGVITLGDLTLYASVFQQLQSALGGLLHGLSTIYESTLFISNLFAFLELHPSIPPSTDGRRPPETWQEGQRFLLNIQNMLGDFRFHLIGVPQTFVDEQLPGLILAERLPKPGETGLVAGSTAARMWDLSVGDHFTTTLANNYATNQINRTLTGILDPNTHDYFDRAMFFGFGTYQKQSGEAANPNLMGYRAPPAMDIDECCSIEFATWTILW